MYIPSIVISSLAVSKEEKQRLLELTKYEETTLSKSQKLFVGIDEAGRGPLAGPVVASAVVYDPLLLTLGVNDSKKLTALKREAIYQKITESSCIYGVGVVDVKTIDQINILQATFLAMKKAVEEVRNQITDQECFFLIDGNQLPKFEGKKQALAKGDSLSITIAAASIIAKKTRDALMEKYDLEYPQYLFKKHKGYGTKAHLQKIQEHGPCSLHRKSFRPISELVNTL